MLERERPSVRATPAEYVAGKCDAKVSDGVTQSFKGSEGACCTFPAGPPEEFLVGGRVAACAGAGRLLLQVTIDGVDDTLEQDREHALQLLADARAEVPGA